MAVGKKLRGKSPEIQSVPAEWLEEHYRPQDYLSTYLETHWLWGYGVHVCVHADTYAYFWVSECSCMSVCLSIHLSVRRWAGGNEWENKAVKNKYFVMVSTCFFVERDTSIIQWVHQLMAGYKHACLVRSRLYNNLPLCFQRSHWACSQTNIQHCDLTNKLFLPITCGDLHTARWSQLMGWMLSLISSCKLTVMYQDYTYL